MQFNASGPNLNNEAKLDRARTWHRGPPTGKEQTRLSGRTGRRLPGRNGRGAAADIRKEGWFCVLTDRSKVQIFNEALWLRARMLRGCCVFRPQLVWTGIHIALEQALNRDCARTRCAFSKSSRFPNLMFCVSCAVMLTSELLFVRSRGRMIRETADTAAGSQVQRQTDHDRCVLSSMALQWCS